MAARADPIAAAGDAPARAVGEIPPQPSARSHVGGKQAEPPAGWIEDLDPRSHGRAAQVDPRGRPGRVGAHPQPPAAVQPEWSYGDGSPAVPRRRGVIELEEGEQAIRHDVATGGAGMRPVRHEGAAAPSEAVAAWREAVGPEIRAPREPRRLDRPLRRIVLERIDAGDLPFDQPLDGEARLVGVGLGVERADAGRVSGVDPARDVALPHIRQLLLDEPYDRPQVPE